MVIIIKPWLLSTKVLLFIQTAPFQSNQNLTKENISWLEFR
ncbi:hypothetical protein AO369_1490 [Moraxella catarrhalis]|nr:hypothetical protein AO369_1490 [Moraxella catarrhalis]